MASCITCRPAAIGRLTKLVAHRYAHGRSGVCFRPPSSHLMRLCLSDLQRLKCTGSSFLRSVQTRAVNKFSEAPFEPLALPNVTVTPSVSVADWNGDLLLMATCEEDFQVKDEKVEMKNESLLGYNAVLNGAILDILESGGFAGKQGQQSKVVRVGAAAGPKYVGLLGLGKADNLLKPAGWGPSAFQVAGAAVTASAKANKSKATAVAFLSELTAEAVGKLTTGVLIGSFEAVRFKSKVKEPLMLEQVEVLVQGLAVEEVQTAIQRAHAMAGGNFFTRYLVEDPPNVATPTRLAEAAQYLAAKYPDCMSVKILEKADCEALDMGCYLGVSECSEEPPKFIHLTYTPQGEVKEKVAIVGKGVTFDSGGYNLKVGGMIELMKFDMGGSAAVLGGANVVGAIKPPAVEVHFIIPACENMVDGKGLRPGDVLRAASGKTVEVNNTDAEGRLTLADGVWYAQKHVGATTVVDVATLTGAAIVALGTDIAAVFSPKDELAEALVGASKTVGEKLWRMPLEQSYMDMLKSSCADMKNTGSRWGGAITGALFIQEFVEEGVDWAHLDIAGPVWNEKLGTSTGYGGMTIGAWVEGVSRRVTKEASS